MCFPDLFSRPQGLGSADGLEAKDISERARVFAVGGDWMYHHNQEAKVGRKIKAAPGMACTVMRFQNIDTCSNMQAAKEQKGSSAIVLVQAPQAVMLLHLGAPLHEDVDPRSF